MDINNFVTNYILHLNDFNENNIKKYNIKGKCEENENMKNKNDMNNDTNKKVKEITSSKELKKFAETRKKYYDKNTDMSNEKIINIFEENIIKTDETNINFFNLENDIKMNYILDYIKRKKYKLAVNIYEKLEPVINNNEILKKYISIDKTFNIISKISFIKKIDNNYYDIVFDSVKKSKKKFFN
jgi:hypothetical protein